MPNIGVRAEVKRADTKATIPGGEKVVRRHSRDRVFDREQRLVTHDTEKMLNSIILFELD